MSDDKDDEAFNKVTCCSCGILFGFPKRIEKEWRRNEKGFNCPNGHPLIWTKAAADEQKEVDKLKAEVASLKTKLESAQAKADQKDKRIAELTAELEIWQPSSATIKEPNDSDQVRSGD
jgi:seryl-tRNA synthetase